MKTSHQKFAAVVAALGEDPRYAEAARGLEARTAAGERGFGKGGLKVNGKLFAMVSSKGQFVVKLPRARVAALVAAGAAELFDPGHGRLMKEWAAILDPKARWAALAKEAHDYVGGVEP
jgi:hypothetical protein